MEFIYVIKSFDTQAWIETRDIIAFRTEKEARKYVQINDDINRVIYSWDRVEIGKMLPPYPPESKMRNLLP